MRRLAYSMPYRAFSHKGHIYSAGKLREEKVSYRGYVIRYRSDRRACWQVYLGKREGRLDTYKGTVTREAARDFWRIVPAEQEESGVIRFNAAASA